MTTIQLVDQRVAAKALNVSLSWLEQDRRSAKTVPWIKLPGARSPKYDLELRHVGRRAIEVGEREVTDAQQAVALAIGFDDETHAGVDAPIAQRLERMLLEVGSAHAHACATDGPPCSIA